MTNSTNKLHKALLLGFAALLISGNVSAQTIQGAGATFPEPIYKKWFADFKQASGISINYQAIGSGAGITQIKNKTVDFGASDAPLTADEEKGMPGPVVHFPTVGGAVAITYNLKGIGCGVHFTPEILSGIFLGTIKNWNDPLLKAANPKLALPDLAIQPIHRAEGSGTTYIFTSYLKKVSPNWASSVGSGKSVNWPGGLSGKGNPGVAATVRRTPGSIGYVELAFALEEKLPYGSVKNQAGSFVSPSSATTTSAIGHYVDELKKNIKTPTVDAPGVNSYPICSLTYILIYRDGGKNAGPVTRLLGWVMGSPQHEASKTLFYAPLPEELKKLNLAAIAAIPGSQAGLK